MRASVSTPEIATTASAPHERGILFTGPNVLKILAGTKTQTRRVAKARTALIIARPWGQGAQLEDADGAHAGLICCPYGAPRDRLWVRETFAVNSIQHARGRLPKERPLCDGKPAEIVYCADGEMSEQFEQADGDLPWRSAIHTPRWASRLTLEITELRVQRLQEISEEDAKAEGAVPGERWADSTYPPRRTEHQYKVGETYIEAFARSWNALHGAGAWERNPFVWAISFRRIG